MITAEQRELRRKYIGASDTPAICGLDSYRTAADVYAEKKGLIGDIETSDAAERGNWLEPALMAFAAHEIGQTLQPHVMFIDEEGLIAANCDAVALDGRFGVEGKTSKMRDGWGDPGTSEVPDRVAVQVQSQMHAAGPNMECVYVAALISMDLALYCVPRDENTITAIVERSREFRRCVDNSIVPDGGMSVEVLKAVRRMPGKVAQVDAEVVRQWRLVKELLKETEEREEALKARVIQMLGDAEGGDVIDADGGQIATLTYYEQSQERIDSKRLRAEHPEIAAKYVNKIKFRKLLHKELKGLVKA